MPWSFFSLATRAYALGVYLCSSDEGLCLGLVPHAYKMSKMIKMLESHSQVKLHCRVQLFKMFMMMIYDVNYDAK